VTDLCRAHGKESFFIFERALSLLIWPVGDANLVRSIAAFKASYIATGTWKTQHFFLQSFFNPGYEFIAELGVMCCYVNLEESPSTSFVYTLQCYNFLLCLA
jgi:hypothetical protein